MRTTESITELAGAVAKAQGEFEGVEKSAANPFFKSKYADLASIIESVAPILSKYGLSLVQGIEFDGEHDLLTSRLMHSSGEWMESTMRLFLKAGDPQSQGSAVSYARRYQIQALLNLRAVDDDGNHASGKSQPQTTRRAAPNPQPQVDSETGEIDPNAISHAQSGKINALFKQKGFPDEREARLIYVNEIIGRSVQSSKELTKKEASKVIEALLEESDAPSE